MNNEIEIVFHCNDCIAVPQPEEAEEATEASFVDVQDEVFIYFIFCC